MNCVGAMRAVGALATVGTVSVDFVSPILSATLAAWTSARGGAVTLRGDCVQYARYNGLQTVLDGDPQPMPSSGARSGRTYTPLAYLATHTEVNRCNRLIGDVLREQLRSWPREITRDIFRVIGELHDNVASHARGRGYSAAQVYDGRRLEFAIADVGCGLLRNASKRDPAIRTDAAAIEWAVREGTTSWNEPDEWAQAMPEDLVGTGAAPGDHHQGLGLWQLHELVRRTGGSMWLATGRAHRLFSSGRWTDFPANAEPWPGLAIEVAIPLDGNAAEDPVD